MPTEKKKHSVSELFNATAAICLEKYESGDYSQHEALNVLDAAMKNAVQFCIADMVARGQLLMPEPR